MRFGSSQLQIPLIILKLIIQLLQSKNKQISLDPRDVHSLLHVTESSTHDTPCRNWYILGRREIMTHPCLHM